MSRSQSRHVSTMRLSSPVPGHSHSRQSSRDVSSQPVQIERQKLPTRDSNTSVPGAGPSALSSALASLPSSTPLLAAGTPPRTREINLNDRIPRSNYGSIDTRQVAGSPSIAIEDPEIVKRHLVQLENGIGRAESQLRYPVHDGLSDEEFSSLRLQGGDITRQVYRWAEEAEGSLRGRYKRSQSFHVNRPDPEDETLDITNIRQPGGFRRNYIRRHGASPAPSGQRVNHSQLEGQQPKLFTNSFFEFLTLYGHFAGEDLEEDDEVLQEDEYFSSDPDGYDNDDDDDDGREYGEGSALLTPGGKRRRKHKSRAPMGTNGSFNAAMLLIKSFVGTGVLFLPRAFLNGGMLFSSMVLLGVAILSF